MANYRRLAALCLVLLSSANIAFGKIRGRYYTDKPMSMEANQITIGNVPYRQLKHHETKGGKRQHNGGHKGGKNGNGGKEKGAKKGEEPEEEDEMHEHEAEGIVHEHEFGGTDHHHHDHGHGGTVAPTEVHTQEPEEHYKGGKHKGSKQKGGKQKGTGKNKHKGKKSGKHKGDEEMETVDAKHSKSAGKYSKSVKKGPKGPGQHAGGGSKKVGPKGYKKYHGTAVEKKSRSERVSKSYNKSKHKLKKSQDGYPHEYTEEPTVHPATPDDIEPTLVEVPLSFYFAFEEKSERRRLDGHTEKNVYEPTPVEIETLRSALMEYAVGLFEYLHEDNPETFYAVTPTIDKIVIHPGAPYPLQVDVTFHVLYNEAPEDAPDPEEVAAILAEAFTTDEFTYFYLWGREDIWNNVSDIKVEPNFEEVAEEPEMDDPVVNVTATMIYDFGVDPTSEPTEEEYDLLVTLTEDFFTDLLTEYYKDDTGTHFEALSIDRHATTFDLEATPPVIIDYSFKAEFEEDCEVPSDDELFKTMAQTMFDDYIRLYLEPSESIWSTVDRVSLLEPAGPADESGTTDPQKPASSVKVPATMLHSYFPNMASRPSKENYETLEMVTNLFFIEALTKAYANNTGTDFTMAATEIEASFYDESAPEPLVVDYATTVFAEGSPLQQDEVFTILQSADYETYIMDYLWKEGEPWNNVNGVMYVARIPTPPSS